MQIACHNPFSVLANKKTQVKQESKPKDTKPTQRKDVKKNEPKKKDEPPKKDAKTITLTEVTKLEDAQVQKQIAKEQEKLDKEAKRERALTDKHDRSGKGHQVRKDGKGVGGWDDNKVDVEVADEVVADDVDAEDKKEKKEKDDGKSEEAAAAEAKAREEESKLREQEEKQMTLEEYQEKVLKDKAPPAANFALRTVDDSGFKGMVAKGKEKGEEKFRIGADKAKKPAATPKKEEKKKEEKEKVQVDVGFRMENPARQQGKGKGGKGEGKGGGRGRGNNQAKEESSAPQVDDEKAFPALGAAKSAESGAEAAA